MSQVIINGRSYIGNQITVINGKVIVNGEDYTPDSKEINIQIDGNIEQLKVDTCLKCTVNGNANYVQSGSGNIDISGEIIGNVQTGSGDIECGNVGGNIQTGSGDIKCNNVSGNVKTNTGDIKYRK